MMGRATTSAPGLLSRLQSWLPVRVSRLNGQERVLIRGRWTRMASAHLRLYTVPKYREVPQKAWNYGRSAAVQRVCALRD